MILNQWKGCSPDRQYMNQPTMIVTSLNMRKRARVQSRLGALKQCPSDTVCTNLNHRAGMGRNVQGSNRKISKLLRLTILNLSYTMCICASKSKTVHRGAVYFTFRPGFRRNWDLQVVVEWYNARVQAAEMYIWRNGLILKCQ